MRYSDIRYRDTRYYYDSDGFLCLAKGRNEPEISSLGKPKRSKTNGRTEQLKAVEPTVASAPKKKSQQNPKKAPAPSTLPPQPEPMAKRLPAPLLLPDFDEKVFDSRHPLFKAIDTGDTGFVELLLKQVPNRLRLCAPDGTTPLHLAVLKGRIGIIRLLRKMGSSAVQASGHKHTPLQLARRLGSLEVIKALYLPPKQPYTPPKKLLPAPLSIYDKNKTVSCPHCRIEVKKNRIEGHIRRTHPDAQEAPSVVDTRLQSKTNRKQKTSKGNPRPLISGPVLHPENIPQASEPNKEDNESNNGNTLPWNSDSIGDGSRDWGYAWRDNGSYGSYPGHDAMHDESDAG